MILPITRMIIDHSKTAPSREKGTQNLVRALQIMPYSFLNNNATKNVFDRMVKWTLTQTDRSNTKFLTKFTSMHEVVVAQINNDPLKELGKIQRLE